MINSSLAITDLLTVTMETSSPEQTSPATPHCPGPDGLSPDFFILLTLLSGGHLSGGHRGVGCVILETAPVWDLNNLRLMYVVLSCSRCDDDDLLRQII